MTTTKKRENFFTDNADIAFHIGKRMDYAAYWDGMTQAEKDASGSSSVEEYRTVVHETLSALGEIIGTELQANGARVEAEPIRLVDGEVELPPSVVQSLGKLLEFGAAGIGIGTEYGGMGMPVGLQAPIQEMIMRACPSTGLNFVWFSGIGTIIERFGSDVVKAEILPKIAAGEWSGSMALTEADAGSDLGALRTYGEREADGTWRLYGSKRFISNGSGQLSLVLAQNGKGARGLGALNLFLCLRKIDGGHNYRVTKIEDKVGLHGSATCELAFDGSVAVLLGEENKGFQHMLHLMNDARIAVGFQGVGHMEAIWRMAKAYCDERKAWGKPLSEHELIAEKLLDMEIELRASRSLCYQTANHLTIVNLGERKLEDASLSAAEKETWSRRVAKSRRLLRRWTPLIKWYTAEKAVEMARTNMQLHGGYGYTKEYRAEWWLRESLILPIYEGTSQIQALMVVKDTLKEVIKNPRGFVEEALGIKVRTLRAADPLRKSLYRAKQLERRAVIALLLRMVKANVRASVGGAKASSASSSKDLARMVKVVARDLVKMENVSAALLHAERLCEIRALVALAHALVRDSEADEARRPYAERFLAKSWLRLEMLLGEIELNEPVLAARLAENAAAGAARRGERSSGEGEAAARA
jgi:alkylation response protein AidB-like acyl-CoA dehydrogenase